MYYLIYEAVSKEESRQANLRYWLVQKVVQILTCTNVVRHKLSSLEVKETNKMYSFCTVKIPLPLGSFSKD